MKIINPENVEISVKVEGVTYTLPALGELTNVPEKHARYWQENLHKFLILRKDEPVKVEETVKLKEAVMPPVEEKTEEVSTPIKEEKVIINDKKPAEKPVK